VITKKPPDINIAQAVVPVMKFRCHGERRMRMDHTGQRRGTGKRSMNGSTGHPRMKVAAKNQVL
jgi:hypothetical protein